MNDDARIYVAGHRGLAGSAITRRLENAGYRNLILRTHAELDLTDQTAVNRFFEAEKPDYVFLAAAKVGGIHANNTYPADFIYTNLAIQTNLIHAAHIHGTKKLLFLGSSCIYPKMAPQPMKEAHLLTGPLEPTNEPYAVAKIAGIKMCQSYNRQYKTSFISVMPTNLYGPGDNFDLNASHVLPAMIRKFHLAKLASCEKWRGIDADEKRFGPIPADIKIALGIDPDSGMPMDNPDAPRVVLWGTGAPRREFLHVDDLADACLFLMTHYSDSEIVNIGTGQDETILDLARMIADVSEYDGEVIFDADKPDGTPRKLLDVSKIKALGWQYRIDLKEGIRQTYEWYKGQV